MTTLIACSHGTRFAAGRDTVAGIVAQIAALLPDVTVLPAFVDVEEPAVADVVADAVGRDSGRGAVVVPLLLSRGFHTGVDIVAAVAPHPTVAASAPLGPHPLLADVLVDRLAEVLADAVGAGWQSGDHVVLAASGSSRPVAGDDVEQMRALLAERIPVPVTVGYAAGARPRIADAITAARDVGATRVIAASYVLAPGFFADLVASAGADLVSAPLGDDPRIAQVAAERFRSVSD